MSAQLYIVTKTIEGRDFYYKGGQFKERSKHLARHMTSQNADRVVRENPGSRKEAHTPERYGDY